MATATLPPPPDADRQWRRGVRAAGLLAAAAALVASVPDLDGSGATALLFAVLALWVVELTATPRTIGVEAALLAVVGLGGATLNGVAPDSAGFLFAYFAAAAMGLRLPLRVAAAGVAAVAVATGIAIVTRGTGHTVTSLTIDVIGVAFAGAVAAVARSAREARDRAAALVAELEHSRAAQAETAALAERARVAREMHDVLAHALSGQLMSLEVASVLAERTGADQRVRAEIDRSLRLARTGLDEIRQAIGALRGEALPGAARLPQLVDEAARSLGLRVDLRTEGEERELAADAGLTLYRTVQECLTNTARYAGPGASCTVELRWLPDRVDLRVSDRPRSLVPERPPGSGYGLTGLRERAELAGGAFDAGPTATGFDVHLVLPYAGAAA